MRVLWIVNTEMKTIAEKYGRTTVVGGWLEQTSELISKSHELMILCRTKENFYRKKIESIEYCAYREKI